MPLAYPDRRLRRRGREPILDADWGRRNTLGRGRRPKRGPIVKSFTNSRGDPGPRRGNRRARFYGPAALIASHTAMPGLGWPL
jgi:hypothetical protein